MKKKVYLTLKKRTIKTQNQNGKNNYSWQSNLDKRKP